ncbi:MAG: hypothetical protein NTU47_13720 [Ignavibacteriales bacterium]|nr:hypothetical protein [Ignavibacteriales bacterium]
MNLSPQPVPLEDPPAESNMLAEIGVFVGTLALAYWSGWSTKDLIWSLWLSSLCLGYLAVAVNGVRRAMRPGLTTLERTFSVMGLIGALLVFSIHFGPFHYIYASILDLLMPLMDHPGRVYIGKLTWRGGVWFSFWETLGIAIVRYWPIAAMNAWRDRSIFLSDTAANTNLGPYKAILRLHFLVMGLGACYGLGLDSFPVYALVFTVLYSPAILWKKIFNRRPPTKKSE